MSFFCSATRTTWIPSFSVSESFPRRFFLVVLIIHIHVWFTQTTLIRKLMYAVSIMDRSLKLWQVHNKLATIVTVLEESQSTVLTTTSVKCHHPNGESIRLYGPDKFPFSAQRLMIGIRRKPRRVMFFLTCQLGSDQKYAVSTWAPTRVIKWSYNMALEMANWRL